MARPGKHVKRQFTSLVTRSIVWLGGFLPRRMGLVVFAWLGRAAYLLLPGPRRATRENLERVGDLVGLSPREAPAIFAELGKNLFDMLRLGRSSRREVLRMAEMRHRERLDAALARRRGVVAVTGHLGSWELMAAYCGSVGYALNVVATPMKHRWLDELLIATRERHGCRNLARGGGGRAILRALERGEIVAALIDQDTRVPGVYVDFMGIPAHTPAGVARLARQREAPVVPMAIHREADGGHVIEVGEEIELTREEDPEREVEENTFRLSKAVESFIRAYPRQWVWMHERWKTRPPEKSSSAVSPPKGRALRGVLAGLGLAIILSGAGALTGCRSKPEEPVRAPLTRIPDQVIADFRRTETREGALLWELSAVRGEVFYDDHHVDLRDMTVDFFDEEGAFKSRLSADSGWVDSQTQDMEARGDVRVESRDGAVLTTTRLRWMSREEKIRTEEEVLITQGESRLRGRGFIGDPTLERFQLLEQVTATVPEAELREREAEESHRESGAGDGTNR